MMNNILRNAVLNALGTAGYVVLIATFLSNASKFFGPDEPKTVLIPIAMLLLLIISAAITGFLVFGRPVLWYLDGKKKEALSLLGYTLGVLFVITVFAFSVLYIVVIK